MAGESITISKKKPGHASMDYAGLREEALEHLRNLAGDTWTDHNLHDPGITILEVLCYAITELGYRTSFNIRDILASSAEDVASNFFTPAQILPSNPLTTDDFRKLVIDCEGIRNAWLEKPIKLEQDIYFHPDQGLNYDQGERVRPTGLYDVQLEFEEGTVQSETEYYCKDREEDFNSNIIRWRLCVGEQEYELLVEFPYWDQLPPFWNQKVTLDPIDVLDHTVYDPGERYHYFFRLRIKTTTRETILDLRIKLLNGGNYTKAELFGLSSRVQTEISSIESGSLLNYFNEKIVVTQKRVSGARSRLNQYRNLGEDFLKFKAVRVQEIGIKASVNLTPEARPEEVFNSIYREIHKFLSPSIRFYSLEDLLQDPDKKKTTSEIFDGPLLENGFILQEEMSALKRRNVIYVSSIIEILMKIEGVSSVKHCEISNSIYGQIINEGITTCLKLTAPETYQPKLSTENSEIKLFLDEVPVKTGIELEDFSPAKIAVPKTTKNDLEIPKGDEFDITSYDSIQNHFPLIYGIGEQGLPDPTSESQLLHSRQLKGYLLVFEQLLANYFSQLGHFTDLFSINESVDKTYFSQPLGMVPKVADLLTERYEETLQEMLEKRKLFLRRRNDLLEHLIARHGESFVDYASYSEKGKDEEGQQENQQELVNHRLAFLQTYPEASRRRSQGFNYLGQTNPEGFLSSGFEKRLARLCGFDTAGPLAIEHILLRPRTRQDKVLKIVKHEDRVLLHDPYSFQLSIFIPSLDRFREGSETFPLNKLGRYVEKVVRQETPAHLLASITWLNPESLEDLRKIYREWLHAVNTSDDPAEISAKLNALIEELYSPDNEQ